MPIYNSIERKNTITTKVAEGNEVIEVAPYFTNNGYTLVGWKYNSTTSEFISKFVKVNAGYSLTPIGLIEYKESTFTNTKFTPLSSSGITTGVSNLFPNQVNFSTVIYFSLSVGILQGFFTCYSYLFLKSFFSFTQYIGGVGNPSTAWVCPPDFSSNTQIYSKNGSGYFINLVAETSSILMLGCLGSTTYITTSNGISFIERSYSEQIIGLASNASNFVIHSVTGIIYTSSDGVTWVNRGSQGYIAGVTNSNTATFGNNLFAILNSTTTVKVSSDNGVNWIQKTLPETNNWLAVFFSNIHNVFLLLPRGVNYFYKTSDFNMFEKITLPFTTVDGMQTLIGRIGDYIHINQYLSRDLYFWCKSNITGLYLSSNICPPNFLLGNAFNSGGSQLGVYKYEKMSNAFFAPQRIAITGNVGYFVRTALD